jgi:hypothetical protein
MQMNWDMLVEGKIHGLSISSTEPLPNVSIDIVCRKQQRWRLTATHVTQLLSNEMRLQNIIDEVRLVDSAHLAAEEGDCRAAIYFLMHGREAEAEEQLNTQGIDEVIHAIATSQSQLLLVRAVYGATVVLLADQVTLEPQG